MGGHRRRVLNVQEIMGVWVLALGSSGKRQQIIQKRQRGKGRLVKTKVPGVAGETTSHRSYGSRTTATK